MLSEPEAVVGDLLGTPSLAPVQERDHVDVAAYKICSDMFVPLGLLIGRLGFQLKLPGRRSA